MPINTPRNPNRNTVGHHTPAVRMSFQELLRMYQKTIYAQEAYNKFVGDGSNETPLYNEHQQDILRATMHKPKILDGEGIRNLEQAKAALGPTTNYLNNRTDFRTIGLLTGIDPENLGEGFSLNARQNGFWDPEEKEKADDLLYNTGVAKAKQADTKLEFSFMQAPGLAADSAAVKGASPYQFFGDTPILQYLANKAYRYPSTTSTTTTPPASTTPVSDVTDSNQTLTIRYAVTQNPVVLFMFPGKNNFGNTGAGFQYIKNSIESGKDPRYGTADPADGLNGDLGVSISTPNNLILVINKSSNGDLAAMKSAADTALTGHGTASEYRLGGWSQGAQGLAKALTDPLAGSLSFSQVYYIDPLASELLGKTHLPNTKMLYHEGNWDAPNKPPLISLHDELIAAGHTSSKQQNRPPNNERGHAKALRTALAELLTTSAAASTSAPPPAITGNPYKDLAFRLAADAKILISKFETHLIRHGGPELGTHIGRDWVAASSIKMDKILFKIEATEDFGPNASQTQKDFGSPKLPLQDFSDSPIVWGNNPSPRLYPAPTISYANTETDAYKGIVNSWAKGLNLGAYRNLLLQIIQIEGLVPTELDRRKGVTKEINSILAFFGTQPEVNPLPDKPEFATINEAIKDPEAQKALQDALSAARRNLTPFDMQCYLMENIEEIVAKRKETGSPLAATYKHVKILKTPEPSRVTNILKHGMPNSPKSKRIQQILNLCPEVYGSLVPHIKIYRIEYEDDGSVSIDPETNKPKERELVIPNFIERSDISNILRGERGRIAGAGIKSFSWGLQGVQPEEVDNNITAKLVLYFQSINDFFRGQSAAGEKEPTFLDLLINSPSAKQLQESGKSNNDEPAGPCDTLRKNLHRKNEGLRYQIKVVAGWATPPNLLDLMPKADPSDIQLLSEAITATRVTLFLTQVRHNLNFSENGSLELSIDYQASLSGLLTSPRADIFAEDPASMRAAVKKIDEELEEYSDRDDQITEHEKKKRKELLEKKKALNTRGKMYKYKKLLQGLFNPTHSKIHALEISGAELLMVPYRDLSPEDRARRAKRRLDPTTGKLVFTNTGTLHTDLLDSVSTAAADTTGETDAAKAYSERAGERYRELQKSGDIKSLPFFFLGDLIDNILEQMKTNNKGQKIMFDTFLADVDMVNPLIAFQVKELDDILTCGDIREVEFMQKLINSDPRTFSSEASKIVNLTNIGDIPISTEAFQLFFKNRVVKKDKESYYFLYFIKELCAELITKALNKACFGPDIRFQQRFDARPTTYIPNRQTRNTAISISSFSKRTDILPSTPVGSTRQALIVQSSDSRPRNLTGNYQSDTEKGIYHHYIGASCGLLKSLRFSREDQAYLREAKIQREGALGAEQLRELYSSQLEMVGNNLYKNGMYIYINPTLLDASESELDYLGLHGYYLVTGVQSKVTPDGFSTSLTALHEGIEFNNSSHPVEVYDVEPELSPSAGPSVDHIESEQIRRENVMLGEHGALAGAYERQVEHAEKYQRGEISLFEYLRRAPKLGLDTAGAAVLQPYEAARQVRAWLHGRPASDWDKDK